MTKKIIIAAMFAVAAAVTAGFAQSHAVNRQAEMMIEGRPFFTDAGQYNSRFLFGSPLGRFDDTGSTRMSVDVGYRYFGLDDESGHYLGGQRLMMGAPGRAFFEVFYGPDILSDDNASLPLHRFGLTLATQTGSDGSFRSSLTAEGYMGKQKWDKGDTTRTIMGFENLRLDFGSQVHPLMRVALYLSFTARLDTLDIPGTSNEDCSFQTNMPEFGINLDFGGDGVPVRSNLSFSYAFSRFVYRSNLSGEPGHYQYGDGTYKTNVPALMNDSLRLFWITQGDFPINDQFTVKPGLLIGYSKNSGEEHVPDWDNGPFEIGDPLPGDRNYGLSGFYFGIGAGFQADKYADLHVEYSLASMSLELGDGYRVNVPFTDERMLHHISFGASTPLHKYLEVPVEIVPRIAYFISGSAGAVGAAHSSLYPLNTVPGKSKGSLYMPRTYLEGFARTSGFTLGVDGRAPESRLSASLWMTFLTKKFGGKSESGMELGLLAGILLK